jgi:hypothetical protein
MKVLPAVVRCVSALLIAASVPTAAGAQQVESRGGQFIPFTRFSGFDKSPGSNRGETVLTSREFVARLHWTELVASWNAEMPKGSYLKIEARALYPNRPTKYYVLALWSPNPEEHPRQSVTGQRDADGDVSTDTLILRAPTDHFQLRVTLGGYWYDTPKMKFLGIALTDGSSSPSTLSPNRFAWGTALDVPQKSQMSYSNGGVLCSPTTVSMILGFWAQKLNRPDLDTDVPEIVKGTYDTEWKGTGNWTFNTAYAGSLEGMRAYVARLSDVSELEDWIARGVPVGLSLCYNKLRDKPGEPSGHLVVCVGFTQTGDVIVNDPGTSTGIRKTFPRKSLITAWAHSRNAAYLIYPASATVPADRFGHWDSWTARKRIRTETPSIPELK